jgi:hypothetical protein
MTKLKLFTQMLTASVLVLGASVSLSQPTQAQNTTNTYFCAKSKGVPTTFARTVTGKRVAIIRWAYGLGGNSPEERCQIVSAKFQAADQKGLLNYLVPGVRNQEQVICVSSRWGGSCSDVLFTLRRGQNAAQVLQDLFATGYQAKGPIVQSEDDSPQIYIDMNLYLREAPTELDSQD